MHELIPSMIVTSRKYGVGQPGRKSRRQVVAIGTIALLELTRDQWAIIDRDDLPLAWGRPWHAVECGKGKFYASNGGSSTSERDRLHRILSEDGKLVDHINGDSLDCRRANMRPCTMEQNGRNKISRRGTSQFQGVSLCRQTGRWQARIRVNGKNLNLGRHDDEVNAARAYDAASLKHYGEYGHRNFPDPPNPWTITLA